jgi:hypothetical protein
MARIRSIKPETFTDADLGELPPLHRWLFVGMWGHADCEGKLLDKPRELRVKILPYDDGADVDAMLWDLAEAGFLVRYERDEVRYLIIPSLPKHQKFHRDEKPKGYPHVSVSTVRSRCEHPGSTLPAPSQHPARSAVNGELCTVNGERGSVNGGGSEKNAAAEKPRQSPQAEVRKTPTQGVTEQALKRPVDEFRDWARPTRLEVHPGAGRDVVPRGAFDALAILIAREGLPKSQAAYLAFLRDPYPEQLEPPWPLGFFLSETQLPKYVSAAERWPTDETTATAPPIACEACGRQFTSTGSTADFGGARLCYPCGNEATDGMTKAVTATDMRLWVEARKGTAA